MVTARNDPRWANVVWFSRDISRLVEAMNAEERAEVLASIVSVRKIGYETEEVLAAIGKSDPKSVLDFMMTRVRAERQREDDPSLTEGDDARFEAIPYNLHRVDKLLSALPGELLRAVRAEFTSDDAGMFPYYGGARLIKAVYPDLNADLQAELLSFSKTGHQTDIDFVIGVVRTYGGDAAVLDICKEIIKVVPERSSAWGEVAAAIECTGVVRGEFGMLEAYQAKRAEIAAWKIDESPRVQAFAVWLIDSLDQMIVSERQRAEAGIELRKYRYGIGADLT
jgi:hypothetical protein